MEDTIRDMMMVRAATGGNDDNENDVDSVGEHETGDEQANNSNDVSVSRLVFYMYFVFYIRALKLKPLKLKPL